MIKMTMHRGEEVQERDLPCDFLSLKVSLYEMNVMRDPSEVSVQDVEAEFASDDPLGQKLIGLIRPGDLLSDVDVAAHQIKTAPQPIQTAMRQMLMDGSFETIADIQSSRDRLLEELCGARQYYYFPLSCSKEDEDGELYESDADMLLPYSEQIQDAIEQDQARDIDTMAMYFWCTDPETNEAIKDKWHSPSTLDFLPRKLLCVKRKSAQARPWLTWSLVLSPNSSTSPTASWDTQ